MPSEGRTVLLEETQVLSLVRRYFPRLQMVAIEIFKRGFLGMNRRDEDQDPAAGHAAVVVSGQIRYLPNATVLIRGVALIRRPNTFY